MEKPEHFKQAGPRDQIMTIISAIEGHISNVAEGITDPKDLDRKVRPRLVDLYLLQRWMPLTWEAGSVLSGDGNVSNCC
jgi:hypothetical protein